MANISNAKKYAVLWLSSQGQKVEEIAKELSLTTDQVTGILPQSPPKPNPEQSDGVAQINSKNLMITHTSGKKTNNVAIMTREASEVNDHKAKKMQPKQDTIKGIFRPKSV